MAHTPVGAPGAERVAVVTGASRGIGRATALRLAQDGYSVAVNYVNNREAAEAVVADIEKAGVRGVALHADVADVEQVRSLMAGVVDHFGRLDALVNNAGAVAFGPIASTPLSELDRVLALNARGVYVALQEAAARISDGGRIVSVSSGATVSPMAGAGLYAASKAVVEHLSFALAKELGSRNLTVNVVMPGVTRTDGLVMDEGTVNQMVAQTPLQRLGQPEDVADVIAFLLSDQARWITGQVLRATGGLV